MLLIRPTLSLSKRLRVTYGVPATDLPPLHEWYCNSFKFSRTDLAIFVNSKTYLPVVLKAAPYGTLVERFLSELSTYLEKLGYPSLAIKHGQEVTFAKTADRSVLGVMNRFIEELEAEDYLGRIQANETRAMTTRLGKTLIGGPKYKTPLERLAEKAGAPNRPTRAHLRLVN